MSGVDHIRALDQAIQPSAFPVPVGVEIHLPGEQWASSQILGLNRRIMPRCVGNLNNQG